MRVSRRWTAIGLMLAFPALFACQAALLALDAPRSVLVALALLMWIGGPALFVVGAVMLWRRGPWTLLPATGPGRVSLALVGAFAWLIAVFFLAVALDLGPDAPEEFFDNLYLAIPVALAGVCAVGAGLVAAYAMLARRERSLSVVGALVIGTLVGIFAAGEIGGHDEPDGSSERQTPTPSASPTGTAPASRTPAPAPNSHSNVTFANVAPGQVRVSFDYAYNQDPAGTAITSITVSALESGRQPLAGYEATVFPIGRGSGHLDVTLSFSPDQLARLQGFSVCFTAPGQPDLGCSMTGYGPN